jgi:hypothetical protein
MHSIILEITKDFIFEDGIGYSLLGRMILLWIASAKCPCSFGIIFSVYLSLIILFVYIGLEIGS